MAAKFTMTAKVTLNVTSADAKKANRMTTPSDGEQVRQSKAKDESAVGWKMSTIPSQICNETNLKTILTDKVKRCSKL